MRVNEFQYDLMIDDALRGVVRRCLRVAATQGLPGAHHFYVTFKTQAPGVSIPPYLKSRYPEEMTIVLQHQFWNLEVTEDFLSVTLSFSDKLERLIVPFAALTAFADPSARFGLQFEHSNDVEDEDDAGEQAEADAPVDATAGAAEAKPTPAPTPFSPRPTTKTDAKSDDAPKEASKTDGDDAGDKVVALDRFRRK